MLRSSISNSTISKKLSPKIIDSQIKTNFYENSIYKSQIEKKVTVPSQEFQKKKSPKTDTLKSFYSIIDKKKN